MKPVKGAHGGWLHGETQGIDPAMDSNPRCTALDADAVNTSQPRPRNTYEENRIESYEEKNQRIRNLVY